MAHYDIANNIGVEQLLDPAVLTATANSTGLDLQFNNGIALVVNVGESGDTLSGSVKIDLILQESDTLGSGYSAVTSTDDVAFGTVDSSGIFATIDAAAEDDSVHTIGYIGSKRFARVAVTLTGTHTNGTPVSVTGLTKPIHKPVSGGNDGTPTG